MVSLGRTHSGHKIEIFNRLISKYAGDVNNVKLHSADVVMRFHNVLSDENEINSYISDTNMRSIFKIHLIYSCNGSLLISEKRKRRCWII